MELAVSINIFLQKPDGKKHPTVHLKHAQMISFQRTKALSNKSVLATGGVILSGLCWYIGGGLNGDFWYLMWLAPLPILLISFKASARRTFLISFIAYLIGRLSWFSYLATVATIVPAVVFTIAFPLFFALIMLANRLVMLRCHTWYAVFAFPVFFTAFECLLIKFSPDGTAASIAYSQSDLLPLIQIASITGILGITFVVTFIPAALAVGWHCRDAKERLRPLAIVSFLLLFSLFLLGVLRINGGTGSKSAKAGLVVLDEETHKMGRTLDLSHELQHTKNYALEISALASQGAKIIVLPERAINLNKELDTASVNILSSSAKQNHVTIIVGYTHLKDRQERNAAMVIDREGKVAGDYFKVHLVKGLEDRFTPGSEIGLFRFDGVTAGVSICKDMDFPDYIKKYGQSNVNFLCIPAWDFVTDDWLHSRMAILRGVENGFSEIRTARQGRLTISDIYGRVIAETSSAQGRTAALIGEVPLENAVTFYSRSGDWFGVVMIISAIGFLLTAMVKRKVH
ncbi:MAG: hypothetical protein LWW85_02155 [Marinilabiliales bacterium]|nr:hypothetical protein [Marinilabiliales bacterium]